MKNNFKPELIELDEELTTYINKIFEQQEKERIVRWLVNSIRDSLDIDKVLETIVEKIGRLLNVDRCLIALFEKEKQEFYFRSKYLKNSGIQSIVNDEKFVCELPSKWKNLLIKNFNAIIINDYNENNLQSKEIDYLKENNIKSLIIIPVVHKEEIFGIIMVHQVEYSRKWEDAHFEILKDTESQIAVAINQAILYSKIQEATKLKSEFLASMSHELRTPLNAIIGFSEMLISQDYGALNEKQRKFLTNISVSGEHLLRLVNDALDLSRIESGNMEVCYELFKIQPVINETVSILNAIAIKKNVQIKLNINCEIAINADLRKFKQIMYNLLSNAIKFTGENSEVIINAFEEDRNLKVEISDNGIGISAKDREKLFKKFSQLDSSLTRKQEGTGLGLTLTKKLVELHKGAIDFESEEGKGSKFWFILPFVKIDNTQAGQLKHQVV
ncbi:MAG TPA: ATP-binding protein [Candidatus Gastranaerophilales bacterium]|nr:ATP-binding protein [Candidatus Gastranaerophilales bacterium]